MVLLRSGSDIMFARKDGSGMNKKTEVSKYTGCSSIACKQCENYVKFLTVSSMQDICWNKGCFYVKEKKWTQNK